MTSPNTDPTPTPSRQPKAESFLDWFQINSKWVAAGAVAVLAAGFIAWYVPRARTLKNQNADKQLLVAKQSFASGNAPLAQADLKKVADRYQGTAAGTEAGLLLAQLHLEQGDAKGAVTVLQDMSGKVKDGPEGATVRGLLGDALAQTDKPAEAAAQYEAAAALTTMPNEKAFLLTKAGHAYMTAGKTAEARKIWEGLSADDSPASGEARVRLGELAAMAARG